MEGMYMTTRENIMAVLNYEKFDVFPTVAFGYWPEVLFKWKAEGHIPFEVTADACRDGGQQDQAVMKLLGFDHNWNTTIAGNYFISPGFTREVLETKPDGSQIIRTSLGTYEMIKPGINSIPAQMGTSLVDREAWETLYLPQLKWDESRADIEVLERDPDVPVGIYCGSMIGNIRNMLGVEGLSYLYVDDEELFAEVIDTCAELTYKCIETMLNRGHKVDYAHFWEDICYKNGPLVSPYVFEQYVGPHYKKMTDLLKKHGINIVSVDCDGYIDHLLPIWLKNGVNTMFPIEFGTWEAAFGPWREKYGRELRGVGGMNKHIFAMDYKAIDKEIERLRPYIEMGGYIPCPDHRIMPDAIFENVQYYCDKLHNIRF